MKQLNLLLAILSFAILMSSCNKDEDPKVNITSPSATSTITIDDVIELRANITDDNKLAKIVVSSTLGYNDNITTFDSETSHEIEINLTLDPATPTGDYSMSIVATDDEGNTGSDEVEIIVE